MKSLSSIFEVRCVLGKKIRMTQQHWMIISGRKHLEMKGREKEVEETLQKAELVRRSIGDPTVCLYYKKGIKYYQVVVVKHHNGEGFVITAYLTDKIKKGDNLWSR